MRVLEGWRVERRRDPYEFTVRASGGDVEATARRADVPWSGLWRRTGIGDRLERSERDCWAAAGGAVPLHRRVVVELAGGETFTTRNGRPTGPLRRSGDARARLRGRAYRFAHTSGSSAEVRRDGVPIAGAWLGDRGRPADAQRAGFGIGVDLRLVGSLDRTDELMVVLFLELFGPPGRKGAVRRVLEGVKEDMLRP